MNLNLHIIAGELADLGFSMHGASSVTQLDCPLPRLFERGAAVQDGACYVCEADDLPASSAANARFVCRGRPDEGAFGTRRRFIWTERDVSCAQLLNAVLGVYEDYEAWGGELQRLVDGSCSMHDFGVAAQRRFGNPTMCFTSSYRCLFHVTGDLSGVAPDVLANYTQLFDEKVPFPEGRVLSAESINFVSSDRRFTDALPSRTPVKTGHDRLLFESASQALFVDGKPTAWIIVNGLVRPIDKRDESMLAIVSTYAKRLLEARRDEGLEDYSKAEELASNLLGRSEPVDERQASRALRPMGWELRHEYVCIVSNVASRNPIPAMLRAMAGIIEQRIPATLAVVHDGDVVMVTNLTRATLPRADLVERVASVVGDGAASICVSRVFADFRDLYYYYRQCIALAQVDGAHQGPVRVFDDYAVEESLRAVRRDGLPLETHYPEGLRLLLKHDEERRSNLVELLRAYLECDRSMVKTVRRTHISKSTCVYRLNLIQEISRLDLDDPAVRFELLLVFALMDLDERSAE